MGAFKIYNDACIDHGPTWFSHLVSRSVPPGVQVGQGLRSLNAAALEELHSGRGRGRRRQSLEVLAKVPREDRGEVFGALNNDLSSDICLRPDPHNDKLVHIIHRGQGVVASQGTQARHARAPGTGARDVDASHCTLTVRVDGSVMTQIVGHIERLYVGISKNVCIEVLLGLLEAMDLSAGLGNERSLFPDQLSRGELSMNAPTSGVARQPTPRRLSIVEGVPHVTVESS